MGKVLSGMCWRTLINLSSFMSPASCAFWRMSASEGMVVFLSWEKMIAVFHAKLNRFCARMETVLKQETS